MTDYLFDFSRVKDFFDKWNNTFHTVEMNGASNFQLVMASYSPTNIDDCLTGSGALDTSQVTGTKIVDCGLVWSNDTITLKNDVTFSIGNEIVPLKALFLRHKATGYVMGYSIAMNNFNVTNQLVIDKDTIFWSIYD